MSDFKQEAQDLANKIEYAIKTEGEITLFQPNGTRAAYALRRLAESDTALTRIRELTDMLGVAYGELKKHDADYHYRTPVSTNNAIVAALSSKDQEKTNG